MFQWREPVFQPCRKRPQFVILGEPQVSCITIQIRIAWHSAAWWLPGDAFGGVAIFAWYSFPSSSATELEREKCQRPVQLQLNYNAHREVLPMMTMNIIRDIVSGQRQTATNSVAVFIEANTKAVKPDTTGRLVREAHLVLETHAKIFLRQVGSVRCRFLELFQESNDAIASK